MSELVLQGPFLTRAQAARRAGVPGDLLSDRPDLLHIRGPFSQEAYFAFQFDEHGIRPDIARVVHVARAELAELEVADWLVRPNSGLNGSSPLTYLNGHGSVEHVVEVIPHRPTPTEEVEQRTEVLVPQRTAHPGSRRSRRLGFTH